MALEVLRQPRGDCSDREQQRGDADQRVAHGADVDDRADVGPQPAHHVAEEPAEAVLEQAGVVVGAGVLDLAGAQRRQHVGRAPTGLAQPEHQQGDEQSGYGDDHQCRSPSECRADEAAEPDAEAGTGEQHHLLDREGPASLVGRVVVAEQAGGRRLGHALAEPERRAHHDQHRESKRQRRLPRSAQTTRRPSCRWPRCGASDRPGSRPAR